VKSEIATFLEAFPNGVVWGNTNQGAGYDLVLLGMKESTPIDVDAVQAVLSRPEMSQVARSLGEVGIYSSVDLFSNYAGTPSDLAPWLADAQINRDRNLRLQYLAGLGAHLYRSDVIYSDMLRYSTTDPQGLFIGSDATLASLREGIRRMQGK
jgi:spermidine synthase